MGAGWTRSAGPDTLTAYVSSARTVKGDPIGFMEGVFGPSISVGGTLAFVSTTDDSTDSRSMLSSDVGFQFSVFPTVAIGLSVSGIRLLGDELVERHVNYGFTTVFDKRFRGHFSVTGGRAAVGFELGVRDWLTVRSGSDGSGWNSGLSFSFQPLSVDWAVRLTDTDCRQTLGVTLFTGGEE